MDEPIDALESRLMALIAVAERVRADHPNDTIHQILRADFLVTQQLYFYATGKRWLSKMDQTQRWIEHA